MGASVEERRRVCVRGKGRRACVRGTGGVCSVDQKSSSSMSKSWTDPSDPSRKGHCELKLKLETDDGWDCGDGCDGGDGGDCDGGGDGGGGGDPALLAAYK